MNVVVVVVVAMNLGVCVWCVCESVCRDEGACECVYDRGGVVCIYTTGGGGGQRRRRRKVDKS